MFEIGDPAYNNTMKLLHLYGTMHDMGFAEGELLGNELVKFLDEIWDYILSEVTDALPPWIPEWLALDIANLGADAALDLTYLLTVKYTTPSFYTELRAMC